MSQARHNAINAIDDLYDLGMVLYVAFRETDYRFGVLHFGEPMGENECPDHLVDPPEFLRGGWTWFHEIPMILHPEKGAVMLRKVGSRESPTQLKVAIEETHSKLTNLEWKIRRRLEQVGYWKDRSIAMGPGVVTTASCSSEIRPVSVPETAIIDRDGLSELRDRIDRLFDHYATESARPIEEWGARLVEDLTDSPGFVGGFVDEEDLADSYHDWGPDLEGLVDSPRSIRRQNRPGESRSDWSNSPK